MRRLIPLLALVALAATAYLVTTTTPETTTTSATAASTTRPPGTSPSGPAGVADRVFDGDSLEMVVDGAVVEVRLLGVNAPERDECWADESRSALTELTTGVTLTLVEAGTDQYGRTLGYLFDGPTNLNLELVARGDGIALATDHPLLPDFLAAEDDAVRAQEGLWAPAACGDPLPETGVGIWAVEPDAPGRDDANPNGEFVTIGNSGPDQDMTGWALRDESSVHRFTFPDGFVLGAGELVTVRSGCGDDTDTDLYWCAATTVWTNAGDTVLLLGPNGAVVERQRYFGD